MVSMKCSHKVSCYSLKRLRRPSLDTTQGHHHSIRYVYILKGGREIKRLCINVDNECLISCFDIPCIVSAYKGLPLTPSRLGVL